MQTIVRIAQFEYCVHLWLLHSFADGAIGQCNLKWSDKIELLTGDGRCKSHRCGRQCCAARLCSEADETGQWASLKAAVIFHIYTQVPSKHRKMSLP